MENIKNPITPKALFKAMTLASGLSMLVRYAKIQGPPKGNGHHYIRHEIHAGSNGILTLSSFNKLIR